MRAFRRILNAALPLVSILCAAGCGTKTIDVTDWSFDLAVNMTEPSPTGERHLAISLAKGDKSLDYELTYVLDGDPSLLLEKEDGASSLGETAYTPIKGKFSLNFSQTPAVGFRLPSLSYGEHTLAIDATNGTFKLHKDFSFVLNDPDFAVRAQIEKDKETSAYMLKLILMGKGQDDIYSVSYEIDKDKEGKKDIGPLVDLEGEGRPSGFKVDFSESDVWTYFLPSLPSGGHTIDLTVFSEHAKVTLSENWWQSEAVDPDTTPTDYTFEASAKFNMLDPGLDDYIYKMTLSLDRGDSSADYKVSYSIDGNESLVLKDEGGNPFFSDWKVNFGWQKTKEFTLPFLEQGQHSMTICISTEKYSVNLDETFTIVEKPNNIGFDVTFDTASSAGSLARVAFLSGRKDRLYKVEMSMDSGFSKVMENQDLGQNRTFSVNFPLIKPGERTFTVTVSDGKYSQTKEFVFTEPARFPEIKVNFEYNPDTMAISLVVLSNPYNLKMRFTGNMYMWGRVTCRQKYQSDPSSPPIEIPFQTQFTDIAGTGVIVPEAGTSYTLCCLADLKKTVEDAYQPDWQWVKNTDWTGRTTWTCLGTAINKHYEVYSQEVGVSIVCEKAEGVSVVPSANYSWIGLLSPSYVDNLDE